LIVVTQPEYNDWKQHPVTVAVMKALYNDREYLKEMLLAGTENDSEIRGRAAATRLILTMSYEDLMESLRENRDE